MPSVSLVITTHNRAAMLPRAIDSGIAAGSDLDVIVVDDCSTDDTPAVCARIDGIRYVRLPQNRGLANARNVGIAEASTEFVAFLDDDDLRLPGSLDAQVAALKATPNAVLCYGQALIGDALRQLPTGEIYPHSCPQGDIFWQLLEDNFIPMPSVVARKSRLLEQNGFATELALIEDWDMWLRLSEHGEVVAVDEPVAIHRKATATSNQMCSDSTAICREALRIQQLALDRPRARAASGAERRAARRKFKARVHTILMSEATSFIHAGNRQAARTQLRHAFAVRPLRTIATGRWPWLLTSR